MEFLIALFYILCILWLIVIYINHDVEPNFWSLFVLFVPGVNLVMCIILTRWTTFKGIKDGVRNMFATTEFKNDIKRIHDEKLSSK